ncbi:MAG: hypothetical protein ACOH2E_00895 [Candidatus Paracaedibacter sp.]
MLKLVHNAHQILQQDDLETYKEGHVPVTGLSPATILSHYQEISPNLYIFRFHDFHHKLSCILTLEMKSNFAVSGKISIEDCLVPVLTGEFPIIDTQRLLRNVPWDDYIHLVLMIRFHLKILEQLLIFCEEKNVTILFLSFEEANLDYMEVFRHFFSVESQVLTSRGKQTEIIIPMADEIYGKLLNFMNRLRHDFHQNLWRDQKNNPAYRQYLKYLSLPEF